MRVIIMAAKHSDLLFTGFAGGKESQRNKKTGYL